MTLTLPNNEKELLLHVCCAPCSGGIIERLLESKIKPTIFFYNPNIYPEKEYILRKDSVMHFCQKKNVSLIDGDYDHDRWLKETKGFENEPEKGKRCDACFKIRLNKTANYASQNNFTVFATSLSISRWKDMEQVHRAGKEAIKNYPEITFWDFNWRKNGGEEKAREVTLRENFYKQKYCGCIYSQTK